MKLNKDVEEVYVRLGIAMPYCVMTRYYFGEELYKRMLIDIILCKYKPINRIILKEDRKYDFRERNSMIGNIYKIVSKNSEKIYIGSTCMKIEDRFIRHILDYEFYNRYKDNYVSSFEVIKCGDARIELLESLDNIGKEELLIKESKYIHNNIDVCVNILDPCSNKVLYDNSLEKEKRRLEKDRYMLKETCKYVIENNVGISSMEDMYIVYMKLRKDIKDRLYDMESGYFGMLNEICRLSNILV
jgi:hypothetical protein